MERGKLLPAMAALAIAAIAGGCFQPLYGERSLTGGPVLRDQLSAVDIVQIEAPKGSDEARLAVEIRNGFCSSSAAAARPPRRRTV
jgi:LPS-assembly lipoprotein